MMLFLVIGLIFSSGELCFGAQGDKGLVIGLWNPASFFTYTEVPKDATSSFQSRSYNLQLSGARITSLTSDPRRAVVFASIGDSIYMYDRFSIWQNRSSSVSIIYKGRSSTFGKIAFDYISNNLYWCDPLLNWIVMKPAYNLNNLIYKVIIQNDLNFPEGLVLDPEDRLMFFSDNGRNPRIERASLDGQNRAVIVYRGLARVPALSVDVLNKKLYWIDSIRDTLDVSDYNGSNRRVITLRNHNPYVDLFYHQNLLHVVSGNDRDVDGYDVSTGARVYARVFYTAQPYAITVYDAETLKSYNDPCSNLPCEHMCVNTKSEPRCLCAEGFQLAADGRTCTDKSQFYERGFIVSNVSTFGMHDVNTVNGRSGVHYLPLAGSFIIESFAVDAMADTIYFIDSKSDSIKKLNMISDLLGTLTYISSGTGLTLDWSSNLLGWIEADTNIMSFSINSGKIVTIYSHLLQLNSLTVDPQNGILFWISGIISKSIVRGTWTRETPTTIVSTADLYNPFSMKYDVISDRLYWLDGSRVKSTMTNGSSIKSHIIAVGATNAFIYKGFFGWIYGDKIHFTTQSSTTNESVYDTVKNAKNVAVFDLSLQRDRQGTCHILNGGCEEICIPLTDGRQCECDIGLQLQQDFTCKSDRLMANFIIIADFSHERILQISLQTGAVMKLPITVNNAVGIAFDKSTNTIIYSEVYRKTIMSTTLDGQNTTVLWRSGFLFADRVAIDYSTGNIYFTAVGSISTGSFIGAIHRTTTLQKTLVPTVQTPRDIVVYPSKGYLYWTERGDKPAIRRSYMDGTNAAYIATEDLTLPNGLAIDFTCKPSF